MRTLVDRWAARIIPDRGNRSIWLLLVSTAAFIAFLGPLAGSSIYYGALGTPFSVSVPRLMLANVVGIGVGAAVLAVMLRHRRPVAMSVPRALGYTFLFAVVSAGVRLAVVAALAFGPGPTGNGPIYLVIQASMGVLLFCAVTTALYYGDGRERAIDQTYAQLARSQSALAHEEESVRARVFDQLHGTVQSEFVAVRLQLRDLAASSSDPRARTVATEVERRLDSIYTQGIESIARALSPAGLQVGLMPALRELQLRLAGACDIRLSVDAIVQILDDPTKGGLDRQVRVAAYRVVEEAVSNAIRHGRARMVDVRISSLLRDSGPWLEMTVADDGCAPASIADGEGLTRMRSRVSALNGTVDVLPTSLGVRVTAAIPLTRADGGRWAAEPPSGVQAPSTGVVVDGHIP